MRLTFVQARGTIKEVVTQDELPTLVVISGPNGAGKSNLLEAIYDGSLAASGIDQIGVGQPQPSVRKFRLAELIPAGDAAQSPTAYRHSYVAAYQNIENYRSGLEQPHSGFPAEYRAEELRRVAIGSQWISSAALDHILESSEKSILEVQLQDFRDHHPLLGGVRDPFSISATEIFLSYHDRYNQNRFEQWRAEKGDTRIYPLTQEQFFSNYGPPPWEVLDETLTLLGLPYRFTPPEGTEDSLTYIAQLEHLVTGDRVTTDQLSSGEKTLLTIALTLFTGERLDRSIEMPKLLLLDETDASLHPMMIQSLLTVLVELFGSRYGVTVFLTTHSPTTVALAPEEALYVMRRSEQPRLIKSSRDEALGSLLVGLPTLSVSVDNRRQVFVESEDDERCYDALYGLIRDRLDSQFSLHFIASGRGGQGNSDAVVRLVRQLREAGNDRVRGIVDRDDRHGAPEGVFFCGDRYAIENLILDPLAVGVYLLRQGLISGADVGHDGLRHFQVDVATAQAVVDFVTTRVLGDVSRDVNVAYVGGFTCEVATEWLNHQGHDLEDKVTNTFKALKQDAKALKYRIVNNALADTPACVPREVVDLMMQLLA